MSLGTSTILNALVSHAAASGYFERVNSYEPKSAPLAGLTASVWIDKVEPVRSSGLASTSVRVAFAVRVHTSMTAEPQEAIDTAVLDAVDALMAAYSGDFELGGSARNIDLLGQHGTALSAQAGYISIGNTMYRVVTITVPVIVNDAWTQSP